MSETVVWIAPDGTSTTLEVEWATRGRFAPPVAYEEEGVPEQPGLRLRAVRHRVREFVLPLWITAADEAALRTEMRSLVAVMDPTRGVGRVRVTAPGGDQREVSCVYQAGLEMDEVLGQTSGPRVQRAPVVFRAHDPYWYATSDVVTEYTISSATATFFPFFPLRLSSSEVFADATVDNVGDVETWPVWTVTGPASLLTLRNFTTGKQLVLTATLTAGETVTIDTRPGAKTVTKNDGTNLFSGLSATSALWPLQRGSNSVRIEVASATASSQVRLAWRPRYLSA